MQGLKPHRQHRQPWPASTYFVPSPEAQARMAGRGAPARPPPLLLSSSHPFIPWLSVRRARSSSHPQRPIISVLLHSRHGAPGEERKERRRSDNSAR